MPSADLEFQKVIFAQVTARMATDLSPGSITAFPAPGQTLPYIEIGESSLSDNTIGHEIEATVHVWSRVEGPHEAKLLQQTVRSALHDTQSISGGGFLFTCVREEYTALFIDRDGEHWHGVQRYRTLASIP